MPLSFYDYQLPMAIIRMKQALGRTVRRSDQGSVAVILDSRVISKRYGKQIAQTLSKEKTVRVLARSQLESAVADFLQTRRDKMKEKSKKEKR